MSVPEKLTAAWMSEQMRVHRLRQKDLAEAMHIAPSGVTRLLSGERKLRPTEMYDVLRFFENYVEVLPKGYDPAPPPSRPANRAAVPRRAAKLVPVYAELLQHAEGHNPAEWREPPATLHAARDVFGFFVSDDVLAPMLLAGDVAYVHPGRPARDGARVVVRDRKGWTGVGLLISEAGVRHLRSGDTMRPLTPTERVQVIAAIETI